jgi:secreted trypsin-like serine protease
VHSFLKVGLVWLVLAGAGLVWGEEVQTRIIGGVNAGPNESEFFAALMFKRPVKGSSSEYVWIVSCGGSYIGDGLVLTAAHCINGTEYKIWLGDPDGVFGYTSCDSSGCNTIQDAFVDGDQYVGIPKSQEGDLFSIGTSGQFRDVFTHKKYNVTPFANDIAMIRLTSLPGPSVAPVALPDANTISFSSLVGSGNYVTAIGVGDTTFNSSTFEASAMLKKVDVPAVSADACADVYPGYDDDIMVCAGFVNGLDGSSDRKDSCQGDSGGPLVDSITGGHVQYGIVSFGSGCAETYGVYADVYGLMYWIDNVKAYWLESINFDWNVNFGTADNSMSRIVNWSIANNSGSSINLSNFDYNTLPAGFSPGTNQCPTTLGSGQSCSVSFSANFNSVGTYEGEAFFDVDGKTYELKFDASVVKPSSSSNRFGGGGSFSPIWLLLMAPLALLRRTRKGPLMLVLLSTLGLAACSSNPFASEPPEVVFNPAITDEGIEFSVMSNGCTVENHLLLRVNGDEVEVVRTQPDMCRATPQLKRFVMPLPEQESVWQLVNPVRYSNRVSR